MNFRRETLMIPPSGRHDEIPPILARNRARHTRTSADALARGGGHFALRFSYHFRFAVAVPMHTTSIRRSPFKSAAAQPAPAMPPSSMTDLSHAPRFEAV